MKREKSESEGTWEKQEDRRWQRQGTRKWGQQGVRKEGCASGVELERV